MRRDVVLPEAAELAGYAELLLEIKDRVRHAQISAARRVNTELVEMYLAIGRLILDRQVDEGWGAKVIARLAEDLKTEFPGTRGFSGRNLRYCRTAARIYADPIGQQLVAQLPWGHVTVLLDKVGDPEIRLWYTTKAVEHGWSRNVLITHIATDYTPGAAALRHRR